MRRLDAREDLPTKALAARIADELDLPRKRVYDLVVRLRAEKAKPETM